MNCLMNWISLAIIGLGGIAQAQTFPMPSDLSESEVDLGSGISSAPATDAGVSEQQVHEIIQQYLKSQSLENDLPKPTKPEPPAKPTPTYPAIKMTGFFQLDAARFDQDATSRATLGDIQDGAGFRRARLGATGNLSEKTLYMFEIDIAQSQARFVDVWG